jgi:predicted RNA-binding Zn-ribbon protein involved in translation (DUF1610 family)
MSNLLDINDLNQSLYCNSCGAEFLTQEDASELVYSRTTASHDIYCCPDCGKESVFVADKKIKLEN